MSHFSHLPNNARVWVYQSDRELTPKEVQYITTKALEFVTQWESHGRKVESGVVVLYNRFLIIAANEEQFQVSGCGIDSSVHFVKALGSELQIDFFDRLLITYKEGDTVKAAKRIAFETLLEEGKVTDDTIVFNNMVTTLAELNNNWEIPLKNSWHYQVFVG